MNITPTINVKTEDDARVVVETLKGIPINWIQFDVSDGTSSEFVSWNDPERAISLVRTFLPGVSVEVHLMIKEQMRGVRTWIDAGVERIIFHAELVNEQLFDEIVKYAETKHVRIMLGMFPDTKPQDVRFFSGVKEVQILCVPPGPSGQKMIVEALSMIKTIRERVPDMYIQVDGGVNDVTIELVRDLGVDSVAVGSFITRSKEPVESYRKLLN